MVKKNCRQHRHYLSNNHIAIIVCNSANSQPIQYIKAL